MSAEPNWEEVAKDKEAKKQAVLDHIASKCTESSEFEDLRAIARCLAKGGKLSISILTGGLANYTYKVSATHCKDCDDHHLFSKLSFPFAMLFPDKPCPLSRTENEYTMMKTFCDLSPGCVATPYFCDDIGNDMKLLVTQWSPVDEQFANQFIDGTVDVRCAEKLARGIATLHCSEVDFNFNEKMRPWFHSLTPILQSIIDGLFNPEGNQDRVSALGHCLGRDATEAMFEHYKKTVDASECLVHGDLHVFNILVGSKPSIETLENFDSSGDVVLCDFEMAHAGVAGHDVGPLRSFPISCAFAHSINGHRNAALDILNWLDTVWDEYEAAMRSDGTSEQQTTKIFRDSLVFTALYCLAYYGLDIHMEFLPIDEGNVEDLTKVKESIGVLGLNCFNWGTAGGSDLSLEELKAKFKHCIEEEMGGLLYIKKPRRNRRSSVLRLTGRRVSDAALHFAKMDRLSFVSADGSLEGHGRRSMIGKLETLPSSEKLEATAQ